MKNLLSIAILFLSINSLLAQEWTRKLQGPSPNSWLVGTGSIIQGYDVEETNDGGYIFFGLRDYTTGAPRTYPMLTKVNAQGFTIWEREYFSDSAAVAMFSELSLVELPNGNLLFGGFNGGNLTLVQTNPLGDTLWTQNIALTTGMPITTGQEFTINPTNDGNYIIALGLEGSTGGIPTAFNETQIIKISPSGTILWQKAHAAFMAEDIRTTLEGGYILAGHENNSASLFKVDANGDSTWLAPLPVAIPTTTIHSVVQTPDSNYVVVSEFQGFAGLTPFAAKVGAGVNANIFWNTMSLAPTPNSFNGIANHISYDDNGYLVATGYMTQPHPILSVNINTAYISKINQNTGAIAVSHFFDYWNTNEGAQVQPTTDGGYIMAGHNESLGYLVKTDSSLNKVIHEFSGYVYRDDNLINCTKDTNEIGLNGWLIQIQKNSTGDTYYTTTDSQGYYHTQLDTGSFTIRASAPNNLWGFCLDSALIQSTNIYNADTIDFGARALYNCPMLTVDISTPFLRRCSTNYYTVHYTNNGTTDAQNAFVEVELDTSLYFISASIPHTILTGGSSNFYTFNLGTIPAGTTGSFTILTEVSCHSILGQLHCAEAHIFPDSSCGPISPLWDRSDIDVEATCLGDSIRFLIRNIGTGNMSTTRQYGVIEDHVIMFTQPFQLNAGQDLQLFVPTNGANYRLRAEQDPNHPYNTYSGMKVDMCFNSIAFSPTANVGALAQYSEDDGSPAISIDCQQNVGSWDPNDKRGFPLGYGATHAIEQTTDLEYHIRFQNTGTDTAFNVIIYDTLSRYLAPSSIVVGASSHSYHWELQGQNVLAFYFDNIMLPDSNVNESLSHGFIKFRIEQKPNNPLGTVIYNSAAIVFDMNAPVITNTTFHTIDEDFIIDNIRKIGDRPNTTIKAYPNPFTHQAIVEVDGEDFDRLELKVVDPLGRLVQYYEAATANQIQIDRKELSNGIYFLQVIGDGQLIATGKIEIR